MKICLDIQPACGPLAGIGRYTRMLAEHLPAWVGPGDTLRLAWFDWRRKGPPIVAVGVECQPIRRLPGRVVMRLWKTVGFPPYDKLAGPADLYHFPNFYLPPLRTGRSLVTLHDLSFRRYPDFVETRNLHHLERTIPETLRRANGVLTISQFSASEIQKLLNVPAERIFVTPLGVSRHFRPLPHDEKEVVRRRLSLPPAYLLHVGTIEPRKNISFLVDLLDALDDYPGHLVLAGGPGWKMGSIWARIERSRNRDRILWLRHVADDDLPSLYACADALLTPSFYEGFGLPPLEAMACGTPVIASDRGSYPEVLGGGAAALLPLDDPSPWADALRSLLHDTKVRETAIQRGLAHAARFRWEETARLTWTAYRNLVVL